MPGYRYFAEISYFGKNYHGWQIQPNATTVQEVLEDSLSTILKEKIHTTGAGRTDTGVHARHFVLHFDCSREGLEKEPGLIYSLNGFLPSDISVFRVSRVHNDAHARFDALSRQYEYLIARNKDPFMIDRAWFHYGELDLERMQEALKLIEGKHNFRAFSRSHTQVKTYECHVMNAHWEVKDGLLVFSITADRFLRNMVRALVGTFIDLGRGKISAADLKNIMESGNRSLAGPSSPAHGLYLHRINYPESIYL